jgi:hypothetical protein
LKDDRSLSHAIDIADSFATCVSLQQRISMLLFVRNFVGITVVF